MEETTPSHSHLTVRDLMTEDPIVVDPEVPLSRVMGLMQEAQIRHVPVIDEQGIVGLVSDRDLAFIHSLPGVFDKVEAGDVERALSAPVAVVMKSRFLVERDVEMVRGETSLKDAVDIFVATGVGALPVIGDDEEILGVLSAIDVLRWAADEVL